MDRSVKAFCRFVVVLFVQWYAIVCGVFSMNPAARHFFSGDIVSSVWVVFSVGFLAYVLGGLIPTFVRFYRVVVVRVLCMCALVSTLGLCFLPHGEVVPVAPLLYTVLFALQMFGLSGLVCVGQVSFLRVFPDKDKREPWWLFSSHLLVFLAALVFFVLWWGVQRSAHWGITRDNTGAYVDHFYSPAMGGWRVGFWVTLLLVLPVGVYIFMQKGWKKTISPVDDWRFRLSSLRLGEQTYMVVKALLLLTGGGTLVYLCLWYVPEFLQHVAKIQPAQVSSVMLWGLGLSVPFGALVFWLSVRYRQYIWVAAVVAMVVAAVGYGYFLDRMLTLTTADPRQELLDMRTENIKRKNYFSRVDSAYLYTVRIVRRKHAYQSGMTVRSMVTDTFYGRIPLVRVGAIRMQMQEKKLSGGQVFELGWLAFVANALALVVFGPYCVLVFSFWKKQILSRVGVAVGAVVFRTAVLGILGGAFAIASVHLATPNLGNVFGFNAVVMGVHVVEILLTISAVGVFVSWFLLRKKQKSGS